MKNGRLDFENIVRQNKMRKNNFKATQNYQEINNKARFSPENSKKDNILSR